MNKKLGERKEKKVEKDKSKRSNKEKNNENSKLKKLLNIRVLVDFDFVTLAIIFIAFIGVWITPVVFQNDTFYTIKIGELISKSGIDMMDHFSWHENLNYTYPHWLYDFITYGIYSIGGFASLYIATMILSSILGISIFLVNKKLTKNVVISFLVTLGALYMLKNYVAARAQLVTFILFIWEVFFIEKFLENKKIGYAIGLVIISLLIANLHCAVWPFFFILFLPYIGEWIISVITETIFYQKVNRFLIEHKIKVFKKKNPESEKISSMEKKLKELKEHVSKVKIKREEERKNAFKIEVNRNPNVKWLILVMVICVFMGLLTPLKDTPFTYLYKTLQGNTTDNISEHQPLTIAKNKDVMCMMAIFLGIFIFTKTKLRLSDWFMIGGLCFLMLSTRRQASMYVLIGSVILTKLIIQIIEKYKENGLEEINKTAKHPGVIFVFSILMLIICYDCLHGKLGSDFIREKSYPIQASNYVLENIDLENAKFYNEYNYGSYMLFRGIPVFIDSRADLYAPEFSGYKDKDIFTDFIDASGVSKVFYEEIFEKYEITHLLIPKKSKINLIITETKDDNYKELYSDDNFIVYERLNIK